MIQEAGRLGNNGGARAGWAALEYGSMVGRLDQFDDGYNVGRGNLRPCELPCSGEFPLNYG